MKQLTKSERSTIYCMMLAEIDNQIFTDENCPSDLQGWHSLEGGFCLMVEIMFDDYDLLENLIELKKHEPSECVWHWFASGEWEPRRECLINALKLCGS